jgi:hypothetical protein
MTFIQPAKRILSPSLGEGIAKNTLRVGYSWYYNHKKPQTVGDSFYQIHIPT